MIGGFGPEQDFSPGSDFFFFFCTFSGVGRRFIQCHPLDGNVFNSFSLLEPVIVRWFSPFATQF